MFLVDRIEKSCADGVETIFLGVFASFSEAEWIAVGFAALCEVVHSVFVDVADKIIESVFIFDDEVDIDLFGIGFQTVAAKNIFVHWMDIWVVPKKSWLNAFASEGFDTVDAAWCAAGMK